MLPFSEADFFAVFEQYNLAIWPLQLVFLAVALAAVLGVRKGGRWPSRAMLWLLAVLWLWMGFVYHGLYFRPINPAASMFAVLFAAEGALLAVAAVRWTVDIRPRADLAGGIGFALVTFALVAYPILGYLLGHRYPASPTFGLPCPTTIFTLGVLLWARPLEPLPLLIPLVWAAIGFTAALKLGVYEDSGLLLAAIASTFVLLRRQHAPPPAGPNDIGEDQPVRQARRRVRHAFRTLFDRTWH